MYYKKLLVTIEFKEKLGNTDMGTIIIVVKKSITPPIVKKIDTDKKEITSQE